MKTIHLRHRNILRQDEAGKIASDNIPDKPIFRHNATAVYSIDIRNALAAFRTKLALFANIKDQASLSTLQKYPFDECVLLVVLKFSFIDGNATAPDIQPKFSCSHSIHKQKNLSDSRSAQPMESQCKLGPSPRCKEAACLIAASKLSRNALRFPVAYMLESFPKLSQSPVAAFSRHMCS
jgi:hypothetical protein